MGDKSPKANQKKANQKSARNDAIASRKEAAITAQQATKLKTAAAKKK